MKRLRSCDPPRDLTLNREYIELSVVFIAEKIKASCATARKKTARLVNTALSAKILLESNFK
jgi:hypothetical protein